MHIPEQEIQRDPEDSLDRVLCSHLFWQAPPELTNCLLDLVQRSMISPIASPPAEILLAPVRPRTWYTTLVTLLTVLAVGVSLTVAWQIYGILGSELGLESLWLQLQTLSASGLAWLYDQLPIARSIVGVLQSLYDQLHWLLIAIVLWLALDGWKPDVAIHQQQQQASS